MAIVAKVKAATSGDTLVLKSTKSGAEKTLSLAYVTAPRLRREGDEPYAFQSREYLRRLLVGKEVQFSIVYTVSSGNREYGSVVLPDGQNVVELAVQEGAVRVHDASGKRDDQGESEPFVEKLRIYEDQARSALKGLWNISEDCIDASYESPEDPKEFFEQCKGSEIDAIIERVISGDRLVVRLILDPKKHRQLLIVLAGIRTPLSTRTDANGMVHPGEEYGDEAKDFVEVRLLQRSVKLSLVGIGQQGQLVANVSHPAGNIAELLLSQGFGRCVDFHSTMIGPGMARYRAAEKYAKDKNLRLFKAHVAKKKDSNSDFDAVVSRIMNADTLYVRNKAGAERRINLSSVRQPKPSDPSQAPFQADAKEFLRKKLIGKHVRVHIDGKRPAQDGYEEKEVATITIAGKNIALQLVESGYASVIRHRREDDDRSPIWDELSAAEEIAHNAQKGMWSPKAPQTSKMVEASESIQKAKSYLSFLQRQRRVPAIVDFVSSGSRFKVIIPKENARLTFVLSGIRAPRTARNANEQSEPFGPESSEWASKKCMQRDVEIDVEDIDRVGGFIGTMYLNRENVAKGLVEEGLASVHPYSAEKSGHGTELFAAESKAKDARKGIWHDWSPEKEAAGQEDTSTNGTSRSQETFEKRSDYRDVIVTNIENTGKLKIQLVGSGTTALEELMSAFRNFHLQPTNSKPLEGPPKSGELVAAKFTEDDTFYRARVRHVDRQAKEAEVVYIDYGNSEKIPWSRLRPLNQPQFSPQKLKPQANDAMLSFVKLPIEGMYAEDALEFIAELTHTKQLVANVDHIAPDGTFYVTLYEPSSQSTDHSLNGEIVSAGLAYIPQKLGGFGQAYSDVIKSLEEKQQDAKKARVGMWKYGDFTPDDE